MRELTVEERLEKLEQENRALREKVARAEPESDDAYFSRITRAGSVDQAGLPSATAQIKNWDDQNREKQDQEFAAALESVTGSSTAVREGFRGFDDKRPGGFDFRDLQKVAQKMDSSTIIAQQILERAAQSLPGESDS